MWAKDLGWHDQFAFGRKPLPIVLVIHCCVTNYPQLSSCRLNTYPPHGSWGPESDSHPVRWCGPCGPAVTASVGLPSFAGPPTAGRSTSTFTPGECVLAAGGRPWHLPRGLLHGLPVCPHSMATSSPGTSDPSRARQACVSFDFILAAAR